MNTAELAKLADELQQPLYQILVANQDYQAIADSLNRPPVEEIVNPSPQQQIPKRLRLADLFEAVDAEDVPDLTALPSWLIDRVEQALAANDRESLANYLAIASPSLTPTSQAALGALLAETEPDPEWKPTIEILHPSRASELGLPPVLARDVQQVLQVLQ